MEAVSGAHHPMRACLTAFLAETRLTFWEAGPTEERPCTTVPLPEISRAPMAAGFIWGHCAIAQLPETPPTAGAALMAAHWTTVRSMITVRRILVAGLKVAR